MSKPLSLIKIIVPLIFMITPCVVSSPAHQKQSLLHFKSSLLIFYETSNSSSFGMESWNSISDCCTWNRVVCSSHSHHITALHLDNIPLSNYFHGPDSRILDPIYGIRSPLIGLKAKFQAKDWLIAPN